MLLFFYCTFISVRAYFCKTKHCLNNFLQKFLLPVTIVSFSRCSIKSEIIGKTFNKFSNPPPPPPHKIMHDIDNLLYNNLFEMEFSISLKKYCTSMEVLMSYSEHKIKAKMFRVIDYFKGHL